MEREELYPVIFDQQQQFLEPINNLIPRAIEPKIISLLKTKMPIIITGVRRCGKSTVLKIIKDRLSLKQKNFLYINFNDERLLKFNNDDFQKIMDYLEENDYEKGCTLFIDEIQEVQNWEKWIDRIKEQHQIFITGSNSKLLSSEIATIMTGRAITIKIFPFSFTEFLDARGIKTKNFRIDLKKQATIRKLFKEYMEFGGFPKRVITKQNIILSELYQNIIYRDILPRFSSKQSSSIKEIIQYLISNIAKPISIRRLSGISGIKNLSTLKKIMDELDNAFLIFSIKKFDYSIRKQMQNPKKIYCIDNGIITTTGFKTSENNGQLLENIIFIELLRYNNEIYYFSGKNECDFLIKKGNVIVSAIQSCYSLDDNNRKREIKGLIEAMEVHKLNEGLIITSNQEEELYVNGKKIIILPVWKWLLEYNK